MASRTMNGNARRRRTAYVVLLTLSCAAGGALANEAFRADAKLNEANEATAKAIALLKSAETPKASEAFETHRKKAIDLLTRAQGEILKAKGE